MFQLSVIWSPDAATKDQLNSIEAVLNSLVKQEKQIMGDTSKLVVAITALAAITGSMATAVGQIKTDSDAVKTAVDALVAAQTSGDQLAIDQAVADLTAASASLQSNASTLGDSHTEIQAAVDEAKAAAPVGPPTP